MSLVLWPRTYRQRLRYGRHLIAMLPTSIDVDVEVDTNSGAVVGTNAGSIRNVATSGGDYAEGSIDSRQGAFGSGGHGGAGGHVQNYIYPPPLPPQLPPLQQNDALDVRLSRLYEAFQLLEERLYRKWSADSKLHDLDLVHRHQRQRETDQYRQVVIWWLGTVTALVVILMLAMVVMVVYVVNLFQRFGWL